jgi:spermidine synthase
MTPSLIETPKTTDATANSLDLWVTERFGSAGVTFKVNSILHRSESSFQTLDIIDTDAFGRMMLLDGCVMTTEKDEFIYHELISHVPLLSLPTAPERVLVIGGGDGGTVREVLKHPSVKEVVLCEIDGDVITASQEYLPSIGGFLENPRVTLEVKDGIAYMASLPPNSFDVILIDSTDPVGPGEGLFTHEFYTNAKNALKPHGILTAQTEGLMALPEGVKKIYSLLRGVFPHVRGYHATVPTYPCGLWSWSFCTKDPGITPTAHLTPQKAVPIEATCRYYNHAVHQAVFALPNFAKALVDG